MSKTPFVDALVQESLPIWQQCLDSDFLRGLEAGTTKSVLMPHAKEVLEYLAPKYNLYILSNGFRELQSRKMRSAGVDGYFRKVILSEDRSAEALAGDIQFCFVCYSIRVARILNDW